MKQTKKVDLDKIKSIDKKIKYEQHKYRPK